MGVRGVSFFRSVFASSFLFSFAAIAEGPIDFSDWGLVAQRDFKVLAQKLYILGDRSSNSGLFLAQNERIEEVQALLALGLDDAAPQVQIALARVFDLRTPIADRSFEFRDKIREEPEILSRLFIQVVQILPADRPKTVENILRRMSFEIDQKLFHLRHPIFGATEVIDPNEDRLIKLLRAASVKYSSVFKLEIPERLNERTTGYLWILEKFGRDWPLLQGLANETDKTGKWRDRFLAEIDERIIDIFDAETSFRFRKAQDQIQSPQWISLKIEDFVYYELEEEERSLFAARLFPELPLADSKVLIERRFFDISEADRIGILNELFLDDIQAAQKFSNLQGVNIDSPASVREFHYDLLKTYFKNLSRRAKPKEDSLRLMSGEKLSWIEGSRNEMRELIEKHREEIQTGIYPSWLIEDLMIRFFPTEDHLKNEGLRFSNEWKRRKLLETSLAEISELQKQGESAAPLIAEKIEKLNAELIGTGIDPESEATFLAAFAYGLTPKSWKDWRGMGKAFGIGFAFVVVTRFVGWKAVSLFIFTDTGLRFITAEYFSDSVGDLDLNRGISTPIGLWTAKSMQDSMSLVHRLIGSQDPEERLDAAADLGRLTRDTIAASLGAAAAGLTMDFARTRRIQKIRGMEREIRELKSRIEYNQSLIQSLQSKLEVLQREIADLESAKLGGTPDGISKQTMKNDVLRKISQLEGEAAAAYQSRLAFYSRQLFAEVLRVVDFVLPLKSKVAGIKHEGFLTRWSRRKSLGIRQYEMQISKLESAIAKVDRANFLAETSPNKWTEPFDYKRLRAAYKKYLSDQNALSRHLGDSETLRSAGDFEGFLKSLEKAGDGLAFQVKDLEGLRASMRDPRSSFSDRGIQALDRWIQENVRAPVLGERPVSSADMSVGKSTERFFSELKLSTQDQWKLLVDKMLDAEPAIAAPRSDHIKWSAGLQKLEAQKAAALSQLSNLIN